jgi:hypothetical protein
MLIVASKFHLDIAARREKTYVNNLELGGTAKETVPLPAYLVI